MTTGSDVTVSLSGQAATFTAGVLAPNTTLALTGGAASFVAGNLLATPTVGLTGQSETFSAGAATPSITAALQGLQASFSAGILGVVGDVTVALTGQSATFAAGSVGVPSTDQPGALDSPLISEGHYRRKKRKRLKEIGKSEQPVFIPPASLERVPDAPTLQIVARAIEHKPLSEYLHDPIDAEIKQLLQQEAERDDEEAISWILRVLEE